MGAEPTDAGVQFRVWAPARSRVEVVLDGGPGARSSREPRVHALDAEADGWFAGLVREAGPGTLYRFRLDGGERFPDPASRFQPQGPHGPSQVVDPRSFRWTDSAWRGPLLPGQVLYELHVGTFTREGTWAAAARELPWLRELGVTLVELMPVAEFDGRFGWGYDGVDLFAPTALYGTPDDMRAFVDRAHGLGLGVVLDVVYNHLGPSGNYLRQFSPAFFTNRHRNEWGEAIDFDGPSSGPVRDFFVANAATWIEEFHLDGLRLDATQAIHDASPEHVLAAIARAARQAAGDRRVLLFAENEPQHARLLRTPEAGGVGLDALWNDDFHHALRVALTGQSEAYYTDYRGSPQELVSIAKRAFLFQGQRYAWQRQRRGEPTAGLPLHRFVVYLQNHDQVANSAAGERLHRLTSPGKYRAATVYLLLSPGTPLLFQGQEHASSSCFLYFADQLPDLARLVATGRAEFLGQFPRLRTPEVRRRLAPPHDRATFERCRLDPAERAKNAEAVALHRDLLRLRREDPVLRAQGSHGIDGAVLAADAFCLRHGGDAGDDRLLLFNLGRDLELAPVPEPLLAPPAGRRWRLIFSSEDPRYGGTGTPAPETEDGWSLPAESALVFAAEEVPRGS